MAEKALQQEWDGNRYLELEGPRRYSPLDAAAASSRHLNRSVVAKSVPRDEWAAKFEKQGTPADRTAPRIEMWPESHLERILAARPALIAEYRLR